MQGYPPLSTWFFLKYSLQEGGRSFHLGKLNKTYMSVEICARVCMVENPDQMSAFHASLPANSFKELLHKKKRLKSSKYIFIEQYISLRFFPPLSPKENYLGWSGHICLKLVKKNDKGRRTAQRAVHTSLHSPCAELSM